MMSFRRPFSTQSTLYILLDYVDEKDEELEIIYRALEETIVLGGAVVGATRLPGIGVGLLGPPFMRLMKISAIRNNLPAVLSSYSHMLEGLMPSQIGTELNLEVGEALDAIVAEADNFSPALSHPLQLLVVTWRPVHLLTETFTSVLSHSHAKYLRAVHVVGVSSVLQPGVENDMPTGDSAGGIWVTGANYAADPYTFSSLFKSWLGEAKGEIPHIQLLFPVAPDEEEPLALLLDMQEMMIDPLSLPSALASRLLVHNNIYRTVSSTQGSSLPVVELEVVRRVNGSSLAAALVGPSTYLLPTGATSLSFDKMWENKQYISSLCQKLNQNGEVLLTRVIAPPGTLAGLVAIIPAPHCSALSMIHVAPAELMLAERSLEGQNSQIDLNDKVTKDIEQRLSRLDVSELRMEDHSTNLVQVLIQHFNKPARGGTARIPPTNVVPASTQCVTRAHTHSFRGRGSGRNTPTHQHPAFMDNIPTLHNNHRGRTNLGQVALNSFHFSNERSK